MSARTSGSTWATPAGTGKATRSSSRRRTSPTRRASVRNGNGLRHSAAMKMTERFTRTAADVLMYQVTVDDPKTYTRPWTIPLPLISPPGFQSCPTSATRETAPYILGAERTEDKAIADDLKKGIVRPRKGVQQGLDAGARPLPGTAGRRRRAREMTTIASPATDDPAMPGRRGYAAEGIAGPVRQAVRSHRHIQRACWIFPPRAESISLTSASVTFGSSPSVCPFSSRTTSATTRPSLQFG